MEISEEHKILLKWFSCGGSRCSSKDFLNLSNIPKFGMTILGQMVWESFEILCIMTSSIQLWMNP